MLKMKNLYALAFAISFVISGCSSTPKTDTAQTKSVEESRTLSGAPVSVIEDVFVGITEHSSGKMTAEGVRGLAERALTSTDPAIKLFRESFRFSGSLNDLMRADKDTQMGFIDALGRAKIFRQGIPAINNKKFYEIFGRVAKAAENNQVAYAKIGYRDFKGLESSGPVLGDKDLESSLRSDVGPDEFPRLREAAKRLEQAVAAADPSNRDKMLKISRRLIANAIKIYKKMGTQVLGEGCALSDELAMENLDKWIDGVESKVSSSDNTRSLVRKMGDELKVLLGLPSTQAAYERIAALSGNQCRTINGKAIGRDLASEMVSPTQ